MKISREAKRAVTRAKNDSWERKCQEIEYFIGGTKTKTAWKTIRDIRQNKNKLNIQMIKMDDWVRYYSEMLMENRHEFQNIQTDTVIMGNVEKITIDEIKRSLKNMKNGKSPGLGGITVELLKNAPEAVLHILRIIFNKCLLDEEEPPREWKLAYLTSIHKKGSKKDCKNYRGMSVSATTGRLYG
jgi:truncated hemoglobin YjbI